MIYNKQRSFQKSNHCYFHFRKMENEREVEVLETGGPSAAQTQHHEEKRQSDDKGKIQKKIIC